MSTKPNIILILADDMGYGDFGAFNGGISKTPALDGLMREGICLTQHFSGSPVCNPSRAALMTGRYPHRTGSIDTLEWYGVERLALRETTLADVFKTAGYSTGLFGKWHLGSFDPRYHPNKRGFDESVSFRGGMHDYYGWRLEFDETVKRADGRYLTDVFTEEAVGFVERHAKEPFFMHVTYNAPHTPLQVPIEDYEVFHDPGNLTRAVSTVYGMIYRMDKGVARILDTVKKCGLEDNTIVVFTSDNGPAMNGEGQDCMKRYNCNFNRGKGHVYEGGIRVPAIVKWPGGLGREKRETHEMVHMCDWFPTLLSMADLEIPCGLKLDGVDVSPIFRGEQGKTCTKRYWQWNRLIPDIGFNAAIRDGDWKLIRPRMDWCMKVPWTDSIKIAMYQPEHFIDSGIMPNPGLNPSPREAPPSELYNITEDPCEENNLAEADPDRVHRMTVDLENWFEEVMQERNTIEDEWFIQGEGMRRWQ